MSKDASDIAGRPGAAERRGRRRRSVVERRDGRDRRDGPASKDEADFLAAIDEYKRVNRRPFPSWTEVLDVVKALGYRKVAKGGDPE